MTPKIYKIMRFLIVLAAQSCLTLCHPMDCSPPAFSVLGVLQARILEWVAISFSRGSAWTRVSCIGRSVLSRTTWEALSLYLKKKFRMHFTYMVECYYFPLVYMLWVIHVAKIHFLVKQVFFSKACNYDFWKGNFSKCIYWIYAILDFKKDYIFKNGKIRSYFPINASCEQMGYYPGIIKCLEKQILPYVMVFLKLICLDHQGESKFILL